MKRQTLIVPLAATCLATAGFFALPAALGTGHASPSHSEADGTASPPNKSHHRDTAASFEQRSVEISAMKPTTERDDSIRRLAGQWAIKDPAAAEQWAKHLPEESDRLQALNLIALSMSDRAPVDAIDLARRNDLGDSVIEGIVGRWADRDFTAASAWVTASTTGEARNAQLAKLALSRAEAAPHEAASLVALSMAEGSAQEEAAISVLHQWLKKDPLAATEWIHTFPDGLLKQRALTEIEGMKTYLSETGKTH